MSLFVDTSVWSLAFRRDQISSAPEVQVLRDALEGGDTVLITGLILQELLQGFAGPRASKDIIARREQRRVAELFGKLDWDSAYDYKAERARKP